MHSAPRSWSRYVLDARLLLPLVLVFGSCGPTPPSSPVGGEREDARSAGTLAMVARLEEMRAARYRSNAYDNSAQAEYRREELAACPPGPARRRLEFEYARELLWSGATDGARLAFEALQRDLARGPERVPELEPLVASYVAASWLRRGEEQNCLARHGADSCLFPIQGGGLHTLTVGSRTAAAGFLALLERDPGDLRSRWLLNLAHMTLGDYPEAVPAEHLVPPASFASERAFPRYPDVAGAAGLASEGHAGGCVVEDLDGDGDLDVMASSRGLDPGDQLRYFENRGDGRFEDRTGPAGLLGLVGGLNLVSGDLDNDGDVDVLVLRGGWMLGRSGMQPNSLLRNEGQGRFSDVTEEAGLLAFKPCQNAALADYDGDGWLDVFVGNEATANRPHASELWHNERDGTFRDVAPELGLELHEYVKGSAWGDYDNDGRPDLYVTVWASVSKRDPRASNRLFHNLGPDGTGRWRFEERGEAAGVRGPRDSFATWFFDYDNDGWLDLWVNRYDATHRDVVAEALEAPGAPVPADRPGRPALYRNRGDGTFEDVAAELGLDHALMTMGCTFGDLDDDGWPDVFLGTGEPDLRTLVPNRVFRNDAGRRFEDVTTAGGFGHLQKGHGAAFGDLDQDGDQDLFMVLGGGFTADTFRNALYENPGHGNHWIELDLVGVSSNRDGIGARLLARIEEDGQEREVHGVVATGGSFGAGSLITHLGLGHAEKLLGLDVLWPSGRRSRLAGLDLDRAYRLREDRSEPEILERTPVRLGGGEAALDPSCHDPALGAEPL